MLPKGLRGGRESGSEVLHTWFCDVMSKQHYILSVTWSVRFLFDSDPVIVILKHVSARPSTRFQYQNLRPE